MREFLEVREDFLSRIIDSEARDPMATCAHCLSPGVWRCVDCLGRPLYCRMHLLGVTFKTDFPQDPGMDRPILFGLSNMGGGRQALPWSRRFTMSGV